MDRVPKPRLDGVLRVFDPLEVILFGSHARGDAGPGGDIDLYVVVADDRQPVSWRAIGEARRDHDGPVDIVVARQADHERRSRLFGALARTVAEEGVVLYPRE